MYTTWFILIAINASSGMQHLSSATIPFMNFINSYGILAIFILMVAEAASGPIPSEVVLPFAGYLAEKGAFGAYGTYLLLPAVLLANFIGMAIDYYIAYFFGKDVVYKHLNMLRIKKSTLDNFDAWFAKNGPFAVFISRLIPVVRGLINFPAGFALMDQKKFFFYSMIGSVIWDFVLIAFGYYALTTSNAGITIAGIGIFIILLYIIYMIAAKKINN